jgi:sortase system peptidoglycan-associated protein
MNVRSLSSSIMTALALVLGTSLALSVSNAQAQELDRKEVKRLETTSVGGGLLIGAAVGGPPGAVLGAIAGGLVGDRIFVGRKNKVLEASLDNTRDELVAAQQANARLQSQLIAAQNQAAGRNLVATTASAHPTTTSYGDSALVLHFRSGSSDVEGLYDEDLKQFVGLVQSVPGAIVEIFGYADRRGDQNDNLWLSQERVQSVEKSLRDLGLRNFRYETTALGEGKPVTAADDVENNFFDRRVVLRVRNSDNELVSSSSR